MRHLMFGAIVCLLLSFNPARLNAQVTYDGCVDVNGVPVASVRWDGLNDVAQARYYNGSPVIIYNVMVLSWLQPQTRLFLYAHECAHHVLGHVARGLKSMAAEQEADCWAINTLYTEGLVNDADLQIIQADIDRFGRGDWEHLPGPMRAINLRWCLGQ